MEYNTYKKGHTRVCPLRLERIYIVDKDDERFCHIFIKGCISEDYTGLFQT